MKKMFKRFAAKLTAFLNRLGEDYDMGFIDEWTGLTSDDAYTDQIEDGLYA